MKNFFVKYKWRLKNTINPNMQGPWTTTNKLLKGYDLEDAIDSLSIPFQIMEFEFITAAEVSEEEMKKYLGAGDEHLQNELDRGEPSEEGLCD